MGGHKGNETCDARAAMVFLIGLAAGTGCTITSKMLFQMSAPNSFGTMQKFTPPLFQTWVMFVGMAFALPAHYFAEWRRRANATAEELAIISREPKVTSKTYMMLAIPSVFDLIATCLMVLGLLYTNASVWMLLRGGGIIFVALMKHFVLHDALKPAMWAGVGIIALGVALVGMASTVGEAQQEEQGRRLGARDAGGDEAGGDGVSAPGDALFGVLITLAGTFVQSVQYTYEEKVMSGDVSAPPWLLIGVEGVTGTLLSTFVLYPIAWFLPGDDNGSYEDPMNTFSMVYNSRTILGLSLTFCVLVFILNAFSVLVTYLMSSVWHAILDNFRPITIWAVQLAVYYCVSDGKYGEAWTAGSWLELGGMALLLVGTAVYNGSLPVPGLTLPGDDLIGTSSAMSSPALSRSPLITLNRAAVALDTSGGSPYVQRVQMGEGGGGGGGGMMYVSVSGDKRQGLLPK